MTDESRAVAVIDAPNDDIAMRFVMNVQEARQRVQQLQEFVQSVMVPDVDYGIIPGTGTKPTLLKPGAEKLIEIYGLAIHCDIVNRIEDWDKPFFHYEVCARLKSKRTGIVVAEGLGSCNSHESRYRWRKGERVCPNCDQPAIIKGKAEYGGGWICFAKKGGCGAKFTERDPAIVEQQVGRVENPDIADLVNTFLKMAKKRAVVDAALSATRSSGLFTQDIEDLPQPDVESEPRRAAPAAQAPNTRTAPAKTTPTRTAPTVDYSAFWPKAHALGYSNTDVHTELGVASLKEWIATGRTLADALDLLQERKAESQPIDGEFEDVPLPDDAEAAFNALPSASEPVGETTAQKPKVRGELTSRSSLADQWGAAVDDARAKGAPVPNAPDFEHGELVHLARSVTDLRRTTAEHVARRVPATAGR